MANPAEPGTENPDVPVAGRTLSSYASEANASRVDFIPAVLKAASEPDKAKRNVRLPAATVASFITAALFAQTNQLITKTYRWYSTTTPGYDSQGKVLLTDLAANKSMFPLGTRIVVGFGPDGQSKTYVMAYDSRTTPDYRVPREFGGPEIGGKLVLADSEEQEAAGITLVDQMADQYLTAKPEATPPVPADFAQYVFDEEIGAEFVTPKRDLIRTNFNPQLIPLPTTGGDDDINWRKVSQLPVAPPTGPTEQVIAAKDIAYTAESGMLRPSLPVRINKRVDADENPLPDVLVDATTRYTLGPYAILDPTGENKPGLYNLANDKFSAIDYSLLSPVKLVADGGGIYTYDHPNDIDPGLMDFGTITLRNSFQNVTTTFGECTVRGEGNNLIGGTFANTDSVSDIQLSNSTLQGVKRLFNAIVSGCPITGGVNAWDTKFQAGNTITGTVTLNAGCQMIELGSYTDNGDGTYTTPDGGTVIDARGSGGGGPSTPLEDVYDVPESVRDAVRNPGNTWVYGDLTNYNNATRLQNGAPAAVTGQDPSILVGTADVKTGNTFDAFETGSTTVAWRYTYGRRNDGSSGWTRIPKTA